MATIEKLFEDLIDAIKENTAAHKGGKAEPAREEKGSSRDRKAEPAREEKGASRDRGKDTTGPTETELKERAAKFIDLPDDDAGNKEYDRRFDKVIDPIFEKAGVGELADLPKEYWGDMLDAIADYEKETKADSGSRRRSSSR